MQRVRVSTSRPTARRERRFHPVLRAAAVVVLLLAGLAAMVMYPPPARRVTWPDGKRFAFTIVDDTDQSTLERIKPIYDLMFEAGLRTTKTVWSLPPTETANTTNLGDTLADDEYRAYVLELQDRGFEIGLHGVRGGSSLRDDVQRGLEEFQRHLGTYPRLHVNHSLNRDNLYWGASRWSVPFYRWGFSLARPFEFSGDDPSSPHFWGDLALERITYVRRFTFRDINLLRINPSMPYRLPHTPFVNYWMDGTDGGSLDAFVELLATENLDRLEREGGVTLVYAHLGAGSFNTEDGGVNPLFTERIADVAGRNGWFAPASDILDHLVTQPGWRPNLTVRERTRLDTFFLVQRLRLEGR
jgi:hypothetical protein